MTDLLFFWRPLLPARTHLSACTYWELGGICWMMKGVEQVTLERRRCGAGGHRNALLQSLKGIYFFWEMKLVLYAFLESIARARVESAEVCLAPCSKMKWATGRTTTSLTSGGFRYCFANCLAISSNEIQCLNGWSNQALRSLPNRKFIHSFIRVATIEHLLLHREQCCGYLG